MLPSQSQPPLKQNTKVSTQSIKRAVKSLLKWKSSNPSNDDFLLLILTLIQTPQNFQNPNFPIKIPLPHPLFSPYSPNFNLCLLIEDRFSLSAKQKIEKEKLPISKLIKLSKFRSNFKSFDQRKKLCDSYDVFIADKRVVSSLGRCFYDRKKTPVAIELGRDDWRGQIEEACGSGRLNLKKGSGGGGCCCVVRVGRGSLMGRDELVENVGAAIDGIVRVVPKKWKNVRGFHLKFSESIALPVYDMMVRDDKVRVQENEGMGSGGIVGKKRKTRDGEKK